MKRLADGQVSAQSNRLRLGEGDSISEVFKARRAGRAAALPAGPVGVAAPQDALGFWPKIKHLMDGTIAEMPDDPTFSRDEQTVYIIMKYLVSRVAMSNYQLSDEQKLALVLIIDGKN